MVLIILHQALKAILQNLQGFLDLNFVVVLIPISLILDPIVVVHLIDLIVLIFVLLIEQLLLLTP